MQGSVLHVQSDHTDTLAVLHEQVERKVFDEEVGVVSEGLTVQGVQDGVTGSVSGGGTSVCLSTLSILERLSTESPLVDLSFLGSRERNTVVLELAKGHESTRSGKIAPPLTSMTVFGASLHM
jgi:hypothetical protein